MPPTNRVADPEDAEATRLAIAPKFQLTPVRYTKTIHFVRHGQGFHNVAGHINHDNYKLEEYADAHLTELGWRQAEQLGEHVRSHRVPVELVVVAPLQRALETAVAAFGPPPGAAAAAASGNGSGSGGRHGAGEHVGNGNGVGEGAAGAGAPLLMAAQEGVAGRCVARGAVPAAGCPRFVAQELCREHIGVHPCDRRSAISTYRQRFPAVDFSLVSPDADALWTLEHRETKEQIRSRGLAFLAWLAARPERSIAVVTHSSFLHFTLGCFGHNGSEALQGQLHKWYENCEMRSVVFTTDVAGEGEAEAEGAAERGDSAAAGGKPGRTDPWHFPGGLHAV